MKNRSILIAVIAIFLVSACLSAFILRHSGKKSVQIVQDGRVLYTVDLSGAEDQDIRIPAADGGYNLVRIAGGTVCIAEADCPDQTCVHMGVLKSEQMPLVCLPHRLIVRFAEDGT